MSWAGRASPCHSHALADRLEADDIAIEAAFADEQAVLARALEELEGRVMRQIREACKGVEWLGSYAVLGPCDYLDIFKAPDLDTASKVSMMVRTYGHAQTEIWAATEWSHFKDVVRSIGGPATPSQLA
jgi:uncharacterized protein with GYD domain